MNKKAEYGVAKFVMKRIANNTQYKNPLTVISLTNVIKNFNKLVWIKEKHNISNNKSM